MVRIFQEKPLFVIPRGQPIDEVEDLCLTSADGLTLRACYLRTAAERRLGVIWFGLEYGSNRWACVPYCQFLLDAGYDVFACEPRGQGDSDHQPGYEPLQWVTNLEVRDAATALAHLKSRPDADQRGVGFFGISKGGSAGIIAAATDPFVRCFVTDGIFGTHSTIIPYMRKWITIYSDRRWLLRVIPEAMYSAFARAILRRVRREKGLRFPHLEFAMPLLAPRPLLMIHGSNDTYIKPEMAQRLYDLARKPRELWIVAGAKHNQAMQVANGEYQRRVLTFFGTHLGAVAPAQPYDNLSTPQRHPPPSPVELVARYGAACGLAPCQLTSGLCARFS
jgi:pimeloyl-ACP methyl ester carboxylesterase